MAKQTNTKHSTTRKAKRATKQTQVSARAISKAFPGATVIEVAAKRPYHLVVLGTKIVATLKVVSK